MYILEYWVSDQEHDWLENIAVGNTAEALKNSPQLKDRMKELEQHSGIWKAKLGKWSDTQESDFIRGMQKAKISLVVDDSEVDRGYFVIRPIDYVEGNIGYPRLPDVRPDLDAAQFGSV